MAFRRFWVEETRHPETIERKNATSIVERVDSFELARGCGRFSAGRSLFDNGNGTKVVPGTPNFRTTHPTPPEVRMESLSDPCDHKMK